MRKRASASPSSVPKMIAKVSPISSTSRLGHSPAHSSPLAIMPTAATATLAGDVNSTGSTFIAAICQTPRKMTSETRRMPRFCSASRRRRMIATRSARA